MTIKEMMDYPKNSEVEIEIDRHKIGDPYTYTEWEGLVKDIPDLYWPCEYEKLWSLGQQRWTLDIGYQDPYAEMMTSEGFHKATNGNWVK